MLPGVWILFTYTVSNKSSDDYPPIVAAFSLLGHGGRLQLEPGIVAMRPPLWKTLSRSLLHQEGLKNPKTWGISWLVGWGGNFIRSYGQPIYSLKRVGSVGIGKGFESR